jgi:hypothetical protein
MIAPDTSFSAWSRVLSSSILPVNNFRKPVYRKKFLFYIPITPEFMAFRMVTILAGTNDIGDSIRTTFYSRGYVV